MVGVQRLGKILPEVAGIYFLIFLWEGLTIPGMSHSDSWRGVSLSLIALPAGAFWIVRRMPFNSWAFVYSVAGSTLFVSRFLSMDRFALWLAYQAPSTTVICICWALFAVGMGFVCRLAAFLTDPL